MKQKMTNQEEQIGIIKTRLDFITDKIKEIDHKQDSLITKVESNYITRYEFNEVKSDVDKLNDTVRKVAWFVVLAVLAALITAVIKTGVTL